MKRVTKESHKPTQAHAKMRIVYRFLPAASLLPFLRFSVTILLIVLLIVGVGKYLRQPLTVSALEFSAHTVGVRGDQVGVLDEVVVDMDGDGDMDIVTAGTAGVRLYTQTSKGKFAISVVGDESAWRVDTADFNKDGNRDIVASLKNSPGVKWFKNEGGGFQGFSIGSSSYGIAAAGDLDKDGYSDIVVAGTEGGEVVLRRWMNNGNATFTSTTLGTNAKVTALAIGDVNGNSYPDIVTGGGAGLQRWDTSNGSTWSRIDIDDANQNKSWIVIGEVTGDDKTDIVTGDTSKDFVTLYRNLDNSAWQRSKLEGDADAAKVAIVDFDGDKDVDILASSQDENRIYWFDNNGSSSFTRQIVVSDLQSVFGVAPADVDGDGDTDFVVADHYRGPVEWYERVRAKPVATAPTNIQQSTTGSGLVTFDTTVSDGDFDATRLRVEYSIDAGKSWHKAAVKSVKLSAGSADVSDTLEYQVGSKNALDTNSHSSIKVNVTWDTKSVNNLGGPLVGDNGSVKLRAVARDAVSVGPVGTSNTFRVDNKVPINLINFGIVKATGSDVQLQWGVPTDSSAFSFKIYYGTNATQVADRTSDVWDVTKDAKLGDIENTTTTITGLTPSTNYSFKLVVQDKFGNESSYPTIAGATTDGPSSSFATPLPSPTPTPTSGGLFPTPTPDEESTPTPLPTPRPTLPPTTFENSRPIADAGADQVVNPNALVILDGTASRDSDGDVLTFVWRQLDGPQLDLLSSRTATPSFSAGDENETYIFSLTVRDPKGASATDIVTVATKALVVGDTTPVTVATPGPTLPTIPQETQSVAETLSQIIDLLLFGLAALTTSISVIDRLARRWREGGVGSSESEAGAKGQVVHYKTGEPIMGATVLVYGADGKLKNSERTNMRGEFSTLFPVGTYTIGVQAEGFTFAPITSSVMRPDQGVLYSGGSLTVRDGSHPVAITIPMKPTGEEVGSMRIRMLHLWQSIQRWSRSLSWPLFLIGAALNTVLIFWKPSLLYLVLEVLYVALVIIKVAMEVRVRPAYGLVRDAITHVPLDLAVVRLYEQGTNRLVMTRVTNGQGRFFALPPAGTYLITATKPGYAVFSKQNVTIAGDQDSALQITTDLMPVTPQAGLAAVRAAVL